MAPEFIAVHSPGRRESGDATVLRTMHDQHWDRSPGNCKCEQQVPVLQVLAVLWPCADNGAQAQLQSVRAQLEQKDCAEKRALSELLSVRRELEAARLDNLTRERQIEVAGRRQLHSALHSAVQGEWQQLVRTQLEARHMAIAQDLSTTLQEALKSVLSTHDVQVADCGAQLLRSALVKKQWREVHLGLQLQRAASNEAALRATVIQCHLRQAEISSAATRAATNEVAVEAGRRSQMRARLGCASCGVPDGACQVASTLQIREASCRHIDGKQQAAALVAPHQRTATIDQRTTSTEKSSAASRTTSVDETTILMSEYHGDRMPTREEVVSPSTSSLIGRVRERARSVQMSIERSQVSPELDSILDSISDLAKPVDTDVAPTIVQAQATDTSRLLSVTDRDTTVQLR